jgi:tRNA threonylcarbamoyladenosine biosynthesis protein TsaB
MFDARKSEVYAAVFKWDCHGFIKIVDEVSVAPIDIVKTFEGPVIYAGEGVLLYRETIIALAGKNALFAAPQHMSPSPANVAWIGLKKALTGDFSAPPDLVPLYIRRSEAEVRYSQKL